MELFWFILIIVLFVVLFIAGYFILDNYIHSTFRRLKQLIANDERFFDDAWLKNDKKDKMKNYLKEHGYKHTKLEDTRNIVGISKIEFFDGTVEYNAYTSKNIYVTIEKPDYENIKKGNIKTLTLEANSTTGWIKK